MRDYEVVYIFKSALPSEEIEGKLERYHAVLTRDDGEVTALEHWGKRQLAYPIQNEANGYYVIAQFRAEPELLSELEQMLKLDEDLLRHLIVLSEGELPLSPSSDDSEGDDDEEAEEDEDEDEDEGDDDGEED